MPWTQNPKLKNQPFGEVATSESHKLPTFGRNSEKTCFWRIGSMILMSCSEGLTKAIILFNHAHHRHHHLLKSNKNLRILKLPATQSRREALHTHLCNQAWIPQHFRQKSRINPVPKTSESAIRSGWHIGILRNTIHLAETARTLAFEV